MKYKVGDKVKVRNDLVVKNYYGTQMFVEEMRRYKGQTFTIAFSSGREYLVKESSWWWTDEMLEDLYKPKKFTSEVVFK